MSAIERAKAKLGPLVENQTQKRCPYPSHEDRHASATFYEDHFWCHACSKGGDTLDYYCLINSLSIREALARLGATSGAPPLPKPQPPKALLDFAEQLVNSFGDGVTELQVAHAIARLAQGTHRLSKKKTTKQEADELVQRMLLTDMNGPHQLNSPLMAFCRKQQLNPVLIHDLIFMEVA